jgi:hypothetical protein
MSGKPRRRVANSKRERDLAAEIKSMLALAKAAQQRGAFTPAVSARSKVSALRTEQARLVAERLAEEETDPLVRIQRLRRMATEAGSYTSAAALAKVEVELQAARDLAASATGDGLDEASDAEILAVVKAAIRSLPDTLVAELAAACDDQLNGRKLRVV